MRAALTSEMETLVGLYVMMLRIRRFEERVAALYRAGEIPGFIHLYIGQEAVAAGVCGRLTQDDVVTSTHRGHGHALAKGCRATSIMAELFGRVDGCCGGRGGSMHIYAPEYGLLGTNGVVAGGIPLAVGAGLMLKNLAKKNVAVAFFGDGASNAGGFYESLNHAAIYKLPVVFVCENNLYATSTPLVSVASNPEIATRAKTFRMPGVAVDGNDVLSVYETAGAAVERALGGEGPTLIEAKTYRICGHHEGDQLTGTYRTREELEQWKQRCPILGFAKRLVEEFGFSKQQLAQMEERVRAEVDDAVEFARHSPHPNASSVGECVFAGVQQ